MHVKSAGDFSTVLRFLLPSLIGVLIFLTPIRWNEDWTIGISVIADWTKALMGDYGVHVVCGLMLATSLLTVLGTWVRLRWIHQNAVLKSLFEVPHSWLLLRLSGTIFGFIYLFQIGPELLKSDEIGGAIFSGIGVNVIPVYVAACLLLPLLTDFGFMEFGGTLARPVFRKIFQLPGRSAIDAVTSFVGASSIGLLITIRQYDQDHYTSRQACVIASNFSIVSIPFCLVIASVAGIESLFISWYGTIVLACLAAAIITPRLPPLSRKPNTYLSGAEEKRQQEAPDSEPLMREAWTSAMQRAKTAPGLRRYFVSCLSNLMFFLFSVLSASLALATIAALITFHTPLFTWLSYPFITLLEFASLPSAAEASPALFSGFLDQYMPAIVAAGIDSPLTSFVLAGLSVCQLIFMSELGVIILRSSLPLSLADLALIFLLRSVIVLPVLIIGAHWVAG